MLGTIYLKILIFLKVGAPCVSDMYFFLGPLKYNAPTPNNVDGPKNMVV